MPSVLKPDNILDVTPERDKLAAESSNDHFDRTAFALRALELVRPPRTTVAICEDATRMRIEFGPQWRGPGEAWALLAIPRNASKRAIALAIAQLSRAPRAWALDVLLATSETGS